MDSMDIGEKMEQHNSCCILCRRSIQLGPHRYEGRAVQAWNVTICKNCYEVNHEGIVPSTYPHLIEHLKTHNIEYQLNEKGWINIPA